MLDLSEISPETPRPIARSEYERMVEMGLFEGERVELLYGVIVRKSPHGPEHDGALRGLRSLTYFVPSLLAIALGCARP
jgi:hypothetical protein